MNTTELYVEYIIIGLETLCWIMLLFFIVIGVPMVGFLTYCVSNIFPSIILVGICYILGLVTDRVSDSFFEKRKQKIKVKYTITSKASLIVWDKYGEVAFAKFLLSRIRILRSTIFNSAIIFLGSYSACKYYDVQLLGILIFIIFSLISIASNFAHKELLNNYYKKTSILDSMIHEEES